MRNIKSRKPAPLESLQKQCKLFLEFPAHLTNDTTKKRKMDLHAVLLSARLIWRQRDDNKCFETNQTQQELSRETFG